MRLVARMTNQDQVGFLVDSLRNAGFDRKDMIISDLADAERQQRDDPDEIADEVAFIKTERDGLWEAGAYADGIYCPSNIKLYYLDSLFLNPNKPFFFNTIKSLKPVAVFHSGTNKRPL